MSSQPNPPHKGEDCLRQPLVAGALTVWIQAQVNAVKPNLTKKTSAASPSLAQRSSNRSCLTHGIVPGGTSVDTSHIVSIN